MRGGPGLPGFALRDVGVVVLDEPVVIDRYAELPRPGLVDTLGNKAGVGLVGYGASERSHDPGEGAPVLTGLRNRMFARSELISGRFVHADEFVRVSFNPGGGTGGFCFRDSGGPVLAAGTDTVLAVNSHLPNFGCAGVGYASRVDIAAVVDWVESFTG